MTSLRLGNIAAPPRLRERMCALLLMETRNGGEVTRLLARNDRLLEPLIVARDDEARRSALGTILDVHARPVIARVVASYRTPESAIGAAEAEDITSTVLLRLVGRLQTVAEDEAEAILSLADFTATLTYNAIYDFLRRRNPERTRLKNRVRYVLTRDPRFRTWTTARGIVCELGSSAPRMRWITRRLEPERMADAIETILREEKRPLLVDEIVSALAELWNVVDTRPVELTSDAPDPARTHAIHLEKRQYLQMLWREIQELREPQRAALLLNLRDADGGNANVLFIFAGIATFDEVAAAIGITSAELTELWAGLPLDDVGIAARLGLTRQQVINLRKAARARLSRRMGQP